LTINYLATIGVGVQESCRMSSGGSYSESCVGVATLGVGLAASCRMTSHLSSLPYLESCVDIGTIGVATLGVGLPVMIRNPV
jgi:hypothetical protein